MLPEVAKRTSSMTSSMRPNFLKGGSRSSKTGKPVISSDGCALPITVTIPRTEVESTGLLGQKHTVYILQAVSFGLTSLSKRSFEDFEQLHAQISSKVSFQLPALPRSYWWGNDDPNTVQDRKPKLELFLQQLLTQPDIISDGEELLMKFLNMPKASAAACRFVLHTSQHWLSRLYETTAEPEGVRVLKDSQLEAALVMVLEAESVHEAKRLACELLARRFRTGGETESTSSSFRACQVKVLLSLLNTAQEPEKMMPPEVRTAARKALLTMACDSRKSWSLILLDFLKDEGMSLLLDASKRSGDEGQRLVVELLLRGFEGPVVCHFAQPDVMTERKSLLNQLFMSSDGFVRVTVGILLAALLTDAEDYGEAAQAETGLAALRQELFPAGQSIEGDLRRLLMEEEFWQFLLRLAASLSAGGASNFALLMMLALVQNPQTILETQGMHELLVEKLTDRQDPQLRGMAAKHLLELYRETEHLGGADADLLGRAVASSAMEALASQEALLQSVTAGCQEASGRHQFVSQLDQALTLTTQSCEALGSQADAWHHAVSSGSTATAEAMSQETRAREGLEVFASRLDGACTAHLRSEEEGATGGTAFVRPSQEELLSSCGPGDVARAQAELDQLMQARRDLGVKLSEQQEALQQITSELESCRSSLIKDAGAAIRAAECQSQREALLREIELGQQKADHLDLQMREACEALSVYKATLEQKRATAPSKPMTKSMQAWMAVCDAQKDCDQQLNSALTSLKRAAESLKEETRCRKRLRQTVQELAQRLMALDEELELLQQQNVAVEEEDETR